MTNAIATAEVARKFIFAGNSRVTLLSRKTQVRYTYKVKGAKNKPNFYFVELLTGPDNTTDYTYLGVVDALSFRTTAKSGMRADSAPIMAFDFACKALRQTQPVIPASLEIWHEGCCGRCNRPLTDPVSIARGLGPECASK